MAGWLDPRKKEGKKKGWIYGRKESKMDESVRVAVNSCRDG